MARVIDFVGDAEAGALDSITPEERRIIDCFNHRKMTALMSACAHKKAKTVKLLVEHGADIHLRDELSNSAVAWAAAGGSGEIVSYLLSKGADRNTRDHSGWTLLHDAVSMTLDMSAARLLLQIGLDPNAEAKGKITPLMVAAARNLGFVKLLVKHGARVNHKDEWGRTALLAAASKQRTEIVRYLIEQGAEVNVADRDDKESALAISVQLFEHETVKLLLAHGADVNARDAKGHSVLDHARDTGDKKLIALIEEAVRESRKKRGR
jgi:ankyrin repeat protein